MVLGPNNLDPLLLRFFELLTKHIHSSVSG